MFFNVVILKLNKFTKLFKSKLWKFSSVRGYVVFSGNRKFLNATNIAIISSWFLGDKNSAKNDLKELLFFKWGKAWTKIAQFRCKQCDLPSSRRGLLPVWIHNEATASDRSCRFWSAYYITAECISNYMYFGAFWHKRWHPFALLFKRLSVCKF